MCISDRPFTDEIAPSRKRKKIQIRRPSATAEVSTLTKPQHTIPAIEEEEEIHPPSPKILKRDDQGSAIAHLAKMTAEM